MGFFDKRRALLLEVIRLCTHTQTIDDLDEIFEGPLKEMLGYECFVCGTGFYSETGCYGYKYYSRNFPMEYFFELRNTHGGVDSPLMERWRESRKPACFESGRDDANFPADWVEVFNKYNLRNTVGHATLDRHGVVGQYFIFARLDEEVGDDHLEILELVTPSLSLALTQALGTEKNEEDFVGTVQILISKRQREILQWIYQGKTNWEISKILDINEETVKYHVDHAMTKLNAKTRAQAIGRALEIGAISAVKLAVNTEPHLKKAGKAPAKKKE
ncbi:MAG: hypothetical protein H6R18_626 [Proteobacteria bacterium]|nr:hypothetical protein [Pseudomonadota bacterium]